MVVVSRERLESVREKALERFWEVVGEEFPEIKSGDFSPDAERDLEGSCEIAITTWLSSNGGKVEL